MLWWTDDLLTGVDSIDQEHRNIFSRAEEILDFDETIPSVKVKQALGFLLQYVNQHFQQEEALMSQHQYPDTIGHKEHHQMITDELNKIIRDMTQTGINSYTLDQLKLLIVEWLALHIHEDDKRFVQYIKNFTEKSGKSSEIYLPSSDGAAKGE